MHKKYAGLALAAILVGCGGGGGNPGECLSGSAQVCAEHGNMNTSGSTGTTANSTTATPNPSGAGTSTTTSTTGTTPGTN